MAAPDESLISGFTRVMDEDLNVSGAWGVVFEWVRETNRVLAAGEMTPSRAAAGLAGWDKLEPQLKDALR